MSSDIWNTLLAGGGALIGVWLGNRSSREQVRQQLDAAAIEAGRGRLFKMRRDVFLGAAQAIARANAAIDQMPDVNASNSDITALIAESNAAIAKVQLVANTETIATVTAVQATLAEAMARLWPGRWSLLARNSRLTECQRVIEAQISDRHRWVELMAQQNARGDADRAAFDRLQAQSNFAEQRRVQFVEVYEQLMDEQVSELHDQVRLAVRLADASVEVMQRAAVAARGELGVASDTERLRGIFSDAAARTHRTVEDLLEHARQARERTRTQFSAGEPPSEG